MANLSVAAVITAGGLGKRFGGTVIKQFSEIDGKPILAHAAGHFEDCELIHEIVLVVPEGWIDFTSTEIVSKYGLRKVRGIIGGGAERQDSVENGFKSLSQGVDIVVVHDGVRPFISTELIERVITEASNHGSAISAIPCTDTIKNATSEDYINNTISRNGIWFAQTPQAFRYDVLKDAYRKASDDGFIGTDESLLVERAGHKVKLVEGSRYNIKITTQEDIRFGEFIAKEILSSTF